MTPQAYYGQEIATRQATLKHIKRRRNSVTVLKLLTFGCMVVQVYWLIEYGHISILFPLAAIALFIVLTRIDTRILRQQRKAEELIRLNEAEKAYLQGDLSPFPTGTEFMEATHPYAGDLDLFGEDSLFRHLNRTVTPDGMQRLASWLSVPCKQTGTILSRQQAVAELSAQPAWCQEFQVQGKLHTTHKADTEVLEQWQRETPFFKQVKQTKGMLYTANTLTLASWAAVATGLLPYSLALLLSLLQLLALSFYIGKINRYHNRLNSFIRSISNYLPLVDLLHRRECSSPLLQEVKASLFTNKKDALQALAALGKIQEALDSRGNILVTFILNGLYMKDMHTLLRLDAWKKEYAGEIGSWTEAVSTTDALVSMATYRFNHPSYVFPEVSDTLTLDMREAGHPLMEGRPCVTNDLQFKHGQHLFIVTGANMAGKSTFLRMVGVNLILAQSGNVVRASHFVFRPTALFTSMRTTDNLAKDTSYFHAELLRLKQLVELAEHEEHLFIILDEMLKGTNSVDKLNGSLAFLRKLLHYPVAGLVATHDLALGGLATEYPGNFSNVCFEITHDGKDIRYDYKLHSGVSNTMNASILLKQMGLI